jgi:hypothetical protein
MAAAEQIETQIITKEEALPHQKSTYNLFQDNKMKEMFENLPVEDQISYKKSGEYMYSYNYENPGNPEEKINESAAYIAEGLKSGLRPSHLDESEIAVMKSVYGDKWYTKYGYSSEKD